MTDTGSAAEVLPSAAADHPPRRADGVVLIGEAAGSGYREPPALARRADGQTIQLTPLLYALLEAVDGRREEEALAASVSARTGRPVSAANVTDLLEKLRPLGLLEGDGGTGAPDRADPLLALRFKVAVSDPERTRRLTSPFARLFNPLVAVPILGAFALVCWWVLWRKGLASATHEAFARPGLLLLVLALTVLSAGFHEFGHAAAARRGGATPGVMGAGLYLVWPAFYTDVTDSYRLGRWGRLRTDLGGLYFNAIVTVATVGAWLLTEYDALLLVVATQILQMLRQLLPLVRFDGYHVLADLTGVPDLFQRIGPTLRALVPGLRPDPTAMALKPWARAVITAWVLVVVPVLALVLLLVVVTLPRIVGTALAAARLQGEAAADAAGSGDVLSMLTRGLSVLVVLLPVAAIAYLLVRLGRRLGGTVWRRTAGRPARRALAGLTAMAVAAGVVWAWWPSEERYRPVQAYEGGTLADAVQLGRAPTGFTVGTQGRGIIALPPGAEAPTQDDPQLAVVLVPNQNGSEPTDGVDVTTSEDASTSLDPSLQEGDVEQAQADTWIFPFDEPPAPDTDDTQALAVNTTDGTTTYDVAFALVWADGDDPVQPTNEAYALASCSDCAAVAVAFQVVLVIDEAATVAPENISVAVNYNCTSCLTFSLAVQLFITLDGPLSESAMAELESLWAEIVAFGSNIAEVPLDEIQEILSGFEQDIIAIIEQDQGPLDGSDDPASSEGATPSTEPSPSEAGESGSGDPSPTSSGSTSADPSSTPTGSSSSPSATTGVTSQPTTTSSPTSSPTPTATSSPSSSSSSTASSSP